MVIERIGALPIPLVMLLLGMLMLGTRRDCFASFTRGALAGARTLLGLLPALLSLSVAISMLRASGVLTLASRLLAPLSARIGLPEELLPLLLTRPFSGAASTAALNELFSSAGPDSLAGLCASVIFGSSDTVVYVLSVYFSSVGIRRTRYAFPVALAVMLFCIFFSCFLCRMLFI